MSDKSKKLTIGIVLASILDEYENHIWEGIIKAAQDLGHNVLSFIGGSLSSSEIYDNQKIHIYELINSEKIDGFILFTAGVSNYVSDDIMNEFAKRFIPKQVISIGEELLDYPSILIDNDIGMKELMVHMIKDHNYKRIAYVRGPETNVDANTRYKVYVDTLKEYDIPFDENIIFSGNFLFSFDVTPITDYIKDHIDELDAVLVINDSIAHKILRKLISIGITVPEQIAIAGFDDIEESMSSVPDLTTVKQPLSEIGFLAYTQLINIILNNKNVKSFTLPTKLIKRKSCGCYFYKDRFDINLNIKDQLNIPLVEESEINNTLIKTLTNEMKLKFGKELGDEKINNWAKQLVSALIINENDISKKSFIFKLEEIVEKSMEFKIRLKSWYPILFKFINTVKNVYHLFEYDSFFESILEYFILIGIIGEKFQTQERINAKHISIRFYLIVESLISIFNLKELKPVLADKLTLAGIRSCYIALYTDLKTKKYAKLLTAFNETMPIKMNKKKFLSKNLLPDNMKLFSDDISMQYGVISLYHKDVCFGYMIIETIPQIAEIYENLSVQISSSIYSSLTMEKIKNYSNNLEKMVKERTKKLNEANKKLKQLDKLKNDFIANITHDFRSPLTVIQNISDLSLMTDPDKKENIENYELILTASLKLKKSIDQLLDLAKMDEKGLRLKISKVNIKAFLSDISQYYQSSLYSTGIQFYTDFPDYPINNFYIDLEKLEEVITNIISNAVKFVDPNEGMIKIKIEDLDIIIRIIIIDNGIGIPKNKLTSVFNRFEQVEDGRNSKYGGTGIGLAFCIKLVDFMQGKIWCESEGKNKGAKFIIEFKKGKNHFKPEDFIEEQPININAEHINKLVKLNVQDSTQDTGLIKQLNNINQINEFNYKKGIILLIDDDKNVTNIVMKYLVHQGYLNFLIANNGKIGLEAIYTYSPDLIICDYNMPEIRGDQIHDEIVLNPDFKEIPFIFLSAVADKELILQRKEKGVSAYLKKPIEKDDLIFTVEYQMKLYYEFLKTRNLATKDELTGVYNRREFYKILLNNLNEKKYHDLTIVLFDIDNFKAYNDTYGHKFGDEILKEIGNVLNTHIRSSDVAARYGGDEFIVLYSGINQKQVNAAVRHLQNRVNKIKLNKKEKKISFTCSFGISSLKENRFIIEKKLGIKNLIDFFIEGGHNKKSLNQKKQTTEMLVQLMIDLANQALFNAKLTFCCECGFKSNYKNDFLSQQCSQCGSKNIKIGRNKIKIFSDE